MPLKLLHHKSYHPYKAENVARVRADQAKAQAEDDETDRRTLVADSEARLDRLRRNAGRKSRRKEEDQGEKALERQLRGEKGDGTSRERGSEGAGCSEIVRPAGWKGKGREGDREIGPEPTQAGEMKHINFWSEQEAGANPSTSQLTKTLEKASKSTNALADMTKMYLDPPRPGWYASPTLERAERQDEKIEVTLERAYRDGEHKRMSDPLGVMVGFLKQREEAKNGRGAGVDGAERVAGWRGRDRYATPAGTPRREGNDLERHVETLLPKRRPGDPLPPPTVAHKTSDVWGVSVASRHAPPRGPPSSAQAESTTRVSSERERARVLLAAKKRANQTDADSSLGGSTLGGETPRTEGGMGMMYNQQEVRWAAEARERERGMERRAGGGWAERKVARDWRQGGAGR